MGHHAEARLILKCQGVQGGAEKTVREAELLHFLFQKLASGFSKHAGEHSNTPVAPAEVVPGSFNSGQQIPGRQGWPHRHTAAHPRGRQPGHVADHRQESGAGSNGRKIQTMCPSSRKS